METGRIEAPDWNTRLGDVLCPLCDYNLRGLIVPRCPECGYRFRWEEVLNPKKRPHRYLFETRPQQNVLSFLQTLSAGLVPWRFWSSLYPTQPSASRRLLIYLLLISAPLVIGVILATVFASLDSEKVRRGMRDRYTLPNPAIVQDSVVVDTPSASTFDKMYPPVIWPPRYAMYRGHVNQYYHMMLAPFIPVLAMCALLLFRISMRRARIRPLHICRCAIYCWDHVLYLGSSSWWSRYGTCLEIAPGSSRR